MIWIVEQSLNNNYLQFYFFFILGCYYSKEWFDVSLILNKSVSIYLLWHRGSKCSQHVEGSTFSFQGSRVLFLWKFLPCFHSSSWTQIIWTLFSFQFIMFKTMITLFSFQFTMSKTIFCIKGPNIFTWDPRLSDILTIPTIWSVTIHRNWCNMFSQVTLLAFSPFF